MDNVIGKRFSVLLAVLLVFFMAASASAFSITVTDLSHDAGTYGPSFVLITDNDLTYDMDSRLGAITYSGTFAGWNFNMVLGASKPISGTPDRAQLDLQSFTVTAPTVHFIQPEILEIAITDTGYTLDSEYPAWSGGSTYSASSNDIQLEASTYYDASDAAYGTATLLSSISEDFGFGSISRDFVGIPITSQATTFSLTTIAKITAVTPSSSTGFTVLNHVAVVPEPATMLLLGLGLLGLAGIQRKRRNG